MNAGTISVRRAHPTERKTLFAEHS